MNNETHALNKVDALLLFRACACFCVVASHVLGNAPVSHFVTIGGLDFTWLVRTSGAFGVWLFFVLSGYLMGKGFYSGRYQLNKASIAQFYWNRFLRIYPLYVVSILVVWFAYRHAFPVDTQNLKTLAKLLLFSFYLPDLFPNSLLWTISTEFRFYILVPLIYLLAQKIIRGRKSFLLLVGAVALFFIVQRYRVYMHHGADPNFNVIWILKSYIPLDANLDLFLFGFLSNYLIRRADNTAYPTRLINKPMATVAFFAVFMLYALFSYKALIFRTAIFSPIFFIATQTIVAMGTCYTLYCFETTTSYRCTEVSWRQIIAHPARLFEIFGTLTFGIYLWHLPILRSFSHWNIRLADQHLFFLIKFAYTFGIATAVAALTYVLIEEPFYKLRRIAFGRRASRVAIQSSKSV